MRTGIYVATLATAGLLGGALGYLVGVEAGPPPGSPGAAPSSPVAEDRPPAEASPALRARLEEMRAAREAEAAEAARLRSELEALKRDRPGLVAPPSLLGAWYHAVDGGEPGLVDLREGGKFYAGDREGKWRLEGWKLRLTWPGPEAPDGAWVDECVVAADGRSYAGKNQNGNVIRGTRKPE